LKTLVLGLGNPILSDDSVGIQVARSIEQSCREPSVTVMEASISGLGLLDLIAGYDRLVLIDAIQTKGGVVGDVYRLDTTDINATRHTGSVHDVNFFTALELGQRLGMSLPAEIVIFAVEVADVTTFSEQCTPEVAPAIPVAAEMVLREIGVVAGS